MNTNNMTIPASPPRLIPSFLAGFNSVANHIHLILLPVLLDLILWFAPRLSIQTFFKPFVQEYSNFVTATGSAELQALIGSSQSLWEQALSRFNLLSALRTLPIGIPSLLAGRGVIENPIGQPSIFSVPSLAIMIVTWLVCVVIGLAGGSIFFGEIARLSMNTEPGFSFNRTWKLFKQTLLFTISIYLLILVLSIPIMLVIMLISLINPLFIQIAVIFLSLILIWFLMPLIFSPHGIYGYEQNVFTAAINSIRLVRYFLPGTGIFLLMAILINQGLDILWTFPPEQSWMTMVGIFGHAFIVTGLIASSFVYYHGGVLWMNEKLQRFAGNKREASIEQ